jgi:hypothetical protein
MENTDLVGGFLPDVWSVVLSHLYSPPYGDKAELMGFLRMKTVCKLFHESCLDIMHQAVNIMPFDPTDNYLMSYGREYCLREEEPDYWLVILENTEEYPSQNCQMRVDFLVGEPPRIAFIPRLLRRTERPSTILLHTQAPDGSIVTLSVNSDRDNCLLSHEILRALKDYYVSFDLPYQQLVDGSSFYMWGLDRLADIDGVPTFKTLGTLWIVTTPPVTDHPWMGPDQIETTD